MPTPVPAVDRAIKIINLLAERSQEPQSLSEIARATGIHKATTAAILGVLVDHAMVRRNDSKQYYIGPEYTRLAFAYADRFPGAHLARVEMYALARELGLSASICLPDRDEMVILDIVGDLRPTYVHTRVGLRIPMAPPLGTIFKAWAPPGEMRDWVNRMSEQYEIDVETQFTVISTIRSRGYSLGSEYDFDLELDTALRRLNREDLDDDRGLTVAMMVADKLRQVRRDPNSESVTYVVAPVFGPDGQVAMSINLFGAPGRIVRRDIDHLAVRLLQSTARVSASIGGPQDPDDFPLSPRATPTASTQR